MSDTKIQVYSRRDLPAQSVAGTEAQLRGSNRGDLVIMPLGKARCALADEGSYFVATNPTPGTAIDGIAASDGLDDTEAYFLLYNNNSSGSGKRIVLDQMRLLVEQAGTNGTNLRWASKIDSTNRYASGGSTITPVNVNMASSEASGAQLYAGAVVPSAATSAARLIDHGQLRSVITVVQDTYTFDFGGEPRFSSALQTTGTAVAHVHQSHVPVVLGPGDMWFFTLYAASQTAALGFEFMLSWWER